MPKLRHILLVVFVDLLVLAGCLYLPVRIHTDRLGAALADQAQDAVKLRYRRQIHDGPALPGTFADALLVHLPALAEVDDRLPHLNREARSLLRDIVDGNQPISATPPMFLQGLADVRPALRGILQATRAAEIRPTQLLHYAYQPKHRRTARGVFALERIGWLIALDIRTLVAQGQTEQAVNECVDAWALRRDLSYHGFFGHGAGGQIGKRVFLPCQAALAAAGNDRREQALRQLTLIRDATVPIAESMRLDDLYNQLQIFGALLSWSTLSRLPAEVRDAAESEWWSKDEMDSRMDRLLLRRAWVVVDRQMPLLRQAIAGPIDARNRVIKEVRERRQHALNPYLRDIRVNIGLVDDHYRENVVRLDMLRAALVLSAVQKPAAPQTQLGQELPAEAALIDPRTGTALSLSPDGRSLVAAGSRSFRTLQLPLLDLRPSPR